MKTIIFAGMIAGLLPIDVARSATTVVGYDSEDRAITGNPFVSLNLGSTGTTALWDGVGSNDHSGYGSFPGYAPWPAPMNPNSGNSSAVLEKVSNGPGGGAYPSNASIYFGGQSLGDISGGVVRVFDATPTLDLATVAFQIQIGDAIAWTFHQDKMPTLSYTTSSGTVSNVAASFESYFGFVQSPGFEGFDIGVRTFGFQWDLSEEDEEITSLWVSINPVQHAQIYGMRLDQGEGVRSTNILPTSIPEPSAVILCLGGTLGFLARRQRM
ncbi:hypothetical protein JIN84_22230 [Luteolibacter yonseiensis]|uniref:PEP-CTERM protein-sorting domain-containing protein n=1 Tax=Luteolibacter yonseiensis TaxID=1144680 RepID=A0A934R7E2_9BACT|nr:hypothetical protein [Luteolibacter yonseiensis]MBK1818354.1 hypothetical protein [Luteolibacter yonseiensis]